MPSTYTTNLGIEKIANGEQSGTWGTTTNTNFDLIDQAVNGVASVTLASAGTSGSPNTLDISNGSASDGRNKFIEFTDGGDLGATAYVQLTPNDAEKVVFVRNSLSGSQSLTLFSIRSSDIRAPRRPKGTRKNTTHRISNARRAKKSVFMVTNTVQRQYATQEGILPVHRQPWRKRLAKHRWPDRRSCRRRHVPFRSTADSYPPISDRAQID